MLASIGATQLAGKVSDLPYECFRFALGAKSATKPNAHIPAVHRYSRYYSHDFRCLICDLPHIILGMKNKTIQRHNLLQPQAVRMRNCNEIILSAMFVLMLVASMGGSLASAKNEYAHENKEQVLLFWASWCGYCKTSLSQFDRQKADPSDELGIRVSAVNVYDKGIDGPSYLSKLGIKLPSVPATDYLEAALTVKTLPRMIIVDQFGNIIASRRPSNVAANNKKWIDSSIELSRSVSKSNPAVERLLLGAR